MDKEKEKYLSYYRNKFKDNFAPAELEFHLHKYYEMAKKSYNPSKGSFSTHLAAYMQKLNRVANYKGGLLKETEYGKSLNDKVMNAYYEIKTLEMRTPEPEDIAKRTGIPVKKVKEILQNNVHSAIVHGIDTQKMFIDTDILTGLDDTEQKVLETIQKNMKPEEAYKYTGLGKTKYYEVRNSIRDRLRKAYLDMLRNANVTSSD